MTQEELNAAFIMLNAEMAAEKAALDKNNPRLTYRQRTDVLEGNFRSDLWQLDCPITFTHEKGKAIFTIRVQEALPF